MNLSQEYRPNFLKEWVLRLQHVRTNFIINFGDMSSLISFTSSTGRQKNSIALFWSHLQLGRFS